MSQFLMLVSEDLLARIDKARAGMPRVAWVRRAVERELDETGSMDARMEAAPPPSARPAAASPLGASRPASAQPSVPTSDADREFIRSRVTLSSAQAKADVKPIPKGRKS